MILNVFKYYFLSGIKNIPLNSLGVISDYDLNIYLDDLLFPQSKYCRKLTREQIMKWQNSEIPRPLTKIFNQDFDSTAVSMFNRKIL